jgi:GT2 family glycosyltransferase
MSRPTVSVVMPFAGDDPAAREAIATLSGLRTSPGDEVILVDNSGLGAVDAEVTIVRALAERSPAYARNAGAARASGEWILFLDSDCRPPVGLLDDYFAEPAANDVGALAGEVLAAGEQGGLAARYGAARSFLSQAAHLAHPYLPRAVAANLMVRRTAFEAVGGFYEGLRAAEDTDFSWRLQQAGWRLELREGARVEHRYRATVRELRAQWRGYAAGRAWLRRRYRDFTPQPAARRAVRRAWRTLTRRGSPVAPAPAKGPARSERLGAELRGAEPRHYLLLDVMLGFDELAGFAMSNRPAGSEAARDSRVVLVADRFPSRGDPLVDFARTLDGARVEATARPQAPWLEVAREIDVAYREDDGVAARAGAMLWLLARHPIRSARDLLAHRAPAASLWALAPAARRVKRSHANRVHALGGEEVQDTARRLAALTGRGLEDR